MHPDNRKKFDCCRIPQWWEKGYTGKGVKVAVFEDTSRGHGRSVADIVSQVAPDAAILSRPQPLLIVEGGELTPETAQALAEHHRGLVNEGMNLIVMSLHGVVTPGIEDMERRILHAGGITLVTSAGNDGDPIEPSKSAYLDTWIAVGAAELVKGKPRRKDYSETGPKLDVLAFSGLRLSWGGYFEGTSAAAPFAAGMLAIYFQYHHERTGRYPTFDEARAFAISNAEDLGEPGRDDLMGYGLFRLPAGLPEIKEEEFDMATGAPADINDFKLSPNFNLREFASKDTGEVKVSKSLVAALQALRTDLRRPVMVNSGYRTEEQNRKAGGSPKSQHMEGTAADIRVAGVNVWDLARRALAVGFTGVGVYPYKGFVHVDVRPAKSLWWENKAGQQLAWDGKSTMT